MNQRSSSASRPLATAGLLLIALLSVKVAVAAYPQVMAFRPQTQHADDPFTTSCPDTGDTGDTGDVWYLAQLRDASGDGGEASCASLSGADPVAGGATHVLNMAWEEDGQDFLTEVMATGVQPPITLAQLTYGGMKARDMADVYPGHWLFMPRGVVDTLTVNPYDSDEMSLELDPWETGAFTAGYPAMIYTLDGGVPDWDGPVEHVAITSVNTGASELTVDRVSSWGSYVDWSLYSDIVIAQHAAWGPSNSPTGATLLLNLTSSSPDVAPPLAVTGCSGTCTAAEFYAGWLFDWLNPTVFDGLELDQGHWTFVEQYNLPVDADNDGASDYGYLSGINQYAIGGATALAALRAHIDGGSSTSDRMLIVDSSVPHYGYRGPESIDGIEIENFPNSFDWRRFSSGLSQLMLFVEIADADGDGTPNVNDARAALSYGVTKEDTAWFYCHDEDNDSAMDDPPNAAVAFNGPDNGNFRLALAASLLAGMPHAFSTETAGKPCYRAYVWDEYTGGHMTEDDWSWLGDALSVSGADLQRDTGDLSAGSGNIGSGWTWNAAPHAHANDCSGAGDHCYVVSGGVSSGTVTLTVSTIPTDTFTYPANSQVFPSVIGATIGAVNPATSCTSGSDQYTLSFRAFGSVTPSGTYGAAPRLARVRLTDWSGTTYYQDVLVPPAAYDFSLTFPMNSSTCVKKVEFMSGQTTGFLSVEDPTLSKGSADRFIRYFERGAVLMNYSDSDWDVDLDLLYGPAGYHRLLGEQNPNNTGELGEGVDHTEFTVPANDALFVAATEWGIEGAPFAGDAWYSGTPSWTDYDCASGVMGAWALERRVGWDLTRSETDCQPFADDGTLDTPTSTETHFNLSSGSAGEAVVTAGRVPVGVQLVLDSGLVQNVALLELDPMDVFRQSATAVSDVTDLAYNAPTSSTTELECPVGTVLVGLSVSHDDHNQWSEMDGVQIWCDALTRNDRIAIEEF